MCVYRGHTSLREKRAAREGNLSSNCVSKENVARTHKTSDTRLHRDPIKIYNSLPFVSSANDVVLGSDDFLESSRSKKKKAKKKLNGRVSACFAAMSSKKIFCHPFNVTLSSLPSHASGSSPPSRSSDYECNADFILSI